MGLAVRFLDRVGGLGVEGWGFGLGYGFRVRVMVWVRFRVLFLPSAKWFGFESRSPLSPIATHNGKGTSTCMHNGTNKVKGKDVLS
jgi:hypothetical protein